MYQIVKRSFYAIALAAAIFLPAGLNADIALLMDNTTPDLVDGLHNGDSVSASGITMTFLNVVVPNGGPGEVGDWGILLSGANDPTIADVIQFDFSFNDDVYINTYDIGTWESIPSGSFFTISGPNGTSGNNLIPEGDSMTEETYSFDKGSIAFFQEGETYTLTNNLLAAGDPLFYLEQITVSVVPEPGSAFVLLAASTAMFVRRRIR